MSVFLSEHMMSATRKPRFERIHRQETSKSELPFRRMAGIRVGLIISGTFSDDQVARITVAMNDAIQLLLSHFDDLSQRVQIVETKVDNVQSDIHCIRKDLGSQHRSVVWPIVASILLGALGIMATIHWS